MASPAMYWHTLSRLRPTQVAARAWYAVVPARIPAHLPALPERSREGEWSAVPGRASSLSEDWTFRLLNTTATWEQVTSDPNEIELLWLYRFHDFEDLLSEGAEHRRAQHTEWIQRWVAAFDPLSSPAWDPYPTSVRASNWVRWALQGGQLDDLARASLAQQMRHLSRRLEYHLMANHLMVNAKALYMVGSFLDGAEADGWRSRGRHLFLQQVEEQILLDGGHIERSPMYHALMLEDLQDVAAAARMYGDEELYGLLSPRIEAMSLWLQVMTHPDGGIAFFNDACHGVALSTAALCSRSKSLGIGDDSPKSASGNHFLLDTGFVRMEAGPAVVFIDASGPGPDWQPGHAHAETLSFEMSLFGERLFVNSGTSCYGSSAERLRQRGTRAHNTVTVDGRNSSDVWGGFRVARRASVVDRWLDQDSTEGSVVSFRGAHDGYRRRGAGALHAREVSLDEGSMLIVDRVSGAFRTAEASVHLHPGVEIAEIRKDGISLRHANHDVVLRASAPGARIEESIYGTGFGIEAKNHAFRFDLENGGLQLDISWLASQELAEAECHG